VRSIEVMTANVHDGIMLETGAQFEDGLPTIDLKREVPEALKPRRIKIATTSGAAGVAQSNVTTLDQSKSRRCSRSDGCCRPKGLILSEARLRLQLRSR
jgi:hypothetical protein